MSDPIIISYSQYRNQSINQWLKYSRDAYSIQNMRDEEIPFEEVGEIYGAPPPEGGRDRTEWEILALSEAYTRKISEDATLEDIHNTGMEDPNPQEKILMENFLGKLNFYLID